MGGQVNDHNFIEGRCVQCGQTPPEDGIFYTTIDRLFGRSITCPTPEEQAELKMYYDAIAENHPPYEEEEETMVLSNGKGITILITTWYFLVAVYVTLDKKWGLLKGFIVSEWRRLWSEKYSETAVCMNCGDRVTKTRMHRDEVYGWFCNKEEYDQFLGWNIPG